ncbi:hypothetical protein F2Q70_00038548 [Brassica cretica]|uniref:Uncharacterized protein n=2 Tax=Brassica cretica TaxID=69181 RepID=A0A3N6R610_BRACR|nr:hypothetical protein F2Q70_00038548 [Brassica cretica]KAF2618346.1 hypothetical protein F2Q68_00040216 [Brassica cretica]KAF3497775.1 hypothetical protein DY000_02052816 [Brassica cretica]
MGKELLCLSPLHLLSTVMNKNNLAAIDPYGSNTGLIDAGTAAFLQTPMSSQGDHATERSNEPTERELGSCLFKNESQPHRGGGIVDSDTRDSSTEEEGGEKSDEGVPGNNSQGTEERMVDEFENPPALTTDGTGGASHQLGARVVEEDPDRAEDLPRVLLLFLLSFLFLAL